MCNPRSVTVSQQDSGASVGPAAPICALSQHCGQLGKGNEENGKAESPGQPGFLVYPMIVLPVGHSTQPESSLLSELSAKLLGPSFLTGNLSVRKAAAHLVHIPGTYWAGSWRQEAGIVCLKGTVCREWMAEPDGVLSGTSQTLMIRDWWMCMIISVMFEFLEYSLEHQLPNFSECWWDHVGAAGKAPPGWAWSCRRRPRG